MLGGASASPTAENTSHGGFKPTSTSTATQRKKNVKNNSSSTRRFSDEQIKSLESLFKMENKLEPRKKLEMARELGLHPRQVAIWFQNRRARWKSKQVEQDYTSLKADYDTLSDRFESLKKEKLDLLQQLSNLCSQLKEPYEGMKDLDSDGELNGNSSSFSAGPVEQDMAIYSDEEDPAKHTCKEDVENIHINMGEENVSNFDLGSLFDQPCSNWWDVWPSS